MTRNARAGIVTVLALLVAGTWMERQTTGQDRPTPEGTPPVRTDLYGDPLPDGAVARLGTVRWRRSPVHNIVSGEMVLSPDGKVLAGGEGGGLVLWETSTGKPLHRLGNLGPVAVPPRPVGFSRNGKHFYSAEGRTVRVWDVRAGQLISEYPIPAGNDSVLASPDGTHLACFGGHDIRLVEAETGKEVRLLDSPKTTTNTRVCAFSPDGKYLAGSDNMARLWKVATGKRYTLLEGNQTTGLSGMAFSADSRLVATGTREGLIQLWDVATGRETRRFNRQPTAADPLRDGENEKLAFTPDSKLLITGGYNTPLRVWDLAAGREPRRFGEGSLGFVLLDDKRVAIARQQVMSIWDLTSGAEIYSFEGHHGSATAAAFSKDGKTVASASPGDGVRTWDTLTGRPLAFRNEAKAGARFCFSTDGQMSACSERIEEGAWLLSLRDVATGGLHRQIKAAIPGHIPLGFALSPDNRLLAYSSGHGLLQARKMKYPQTVGVWEVATGKELYRLPGTALLQGNLTFSPDSKTLALRDTYRGGGRPDVTELHDADTGRPLYPLGGAGREGYGQGLAFSPDGRLLLSFSGPAQDRSGNLWEVASATERGTLTGLEFFSWVAAFSPDGRTLAWAGANSTIRLWDVATCRERACLRGHVAAVWCLAFSADGRHLVSGSDDTTLLVWDAASLLKPTEPRPAPPSPQDLEAAWAALAGTDAKAAHQAIHTLISAPAHCLPLLRQRLRPAAAVAAEDLKQWVKELDDARFAPRDLASRQLEAAGATAEPHLKQALSGQPSAELRQRVEQLLQKLRGPVTHPETLRSIRAIEVLEHVATADARALLKALAGGAPEARQTREAKAALQWLAGRPTPSP